MQKLKIGIIFGGRSGEHEVSIVSAESVINALDKEKYEVIPIGITKEGKWIAGSSAMQYLKEGIKNLPFKSILPPDPTEMRLTNVETKSLKPITGEPAYTELDVIFPVMHGTTGEDGCLQGLLEMANIAYVGAGVLGSAVGMDKIIQKQLLADAKIPLVSFDWFLASEFFKNKDELLKRLEDKLRYPMFVKPANSGSSVGISKCHKQKELIAGILDAARYDRKILVEEGIDNAKEIEIAVLGNDSPKASLPGEIIPSNEFYDYDAKYIDGQSEAVIPADLPQEVILKVQQLAVAAFKTLDLAGLARVDFLITKDDFKIYLNEANTIPGFTSVSMYPKLWAASGLAYPALLDKLIELALERFSEKKQLLTSYQPKVEWHKK